MTTLTDLVNSFDHTSKEYEEFLQDVIFFNGDIPFNAEEVGVVQSAIIAAVNARLNQAHTRYGGLAILDKILPQCSKDVLLKYSSLWITKAAQILESVHSNSQELTMACKIIGCLIIQSKDIPEIHKQISMLNVKQLITVIGSLDSERKCGAVYYLIAVLLHQYPEVCERFQASLRKIIFVQIDSTDENLVNASGKCYTLLAKATERSFKPPPTKPNYTGWLYNEALICNSLHVIMDDLFSSLIELETVDIWDKLDLPAISEKNIIQFYSKQKQRFTNLCRYLTFMLCGYDKKNSVSPYDILRVVCRGLAIQPSNLKNRGSFKEQMLYIMLPKLHIALFTVLDALINGFKEQLVPFGKTILQLFHQTLEWTETVVENQVTISGSKPFKYVRISVYKCLTSWLTYTNALSGVETIVDEILPSILKDVIPEKDRILLTIQKTQNLSKRALKRLRDSQYENSTYLNNSPQAKKDTCLDVDICKEALIVIQNIFFSAGSWLKQAVFKTTQNVVVPLLYDAYMSCSEQKFYKENAECRLELLRVLRALQMNPHSQTSSPTQYSIEIFEIALNDKYVHILREAKIALAELEKIVHPVAPSLQLVQVEQVQKEYVTGGQDEDHVFTSEDINMMDDENNSDDDMAPSSTKRSKTTNVEVMGSSEPTERTALRSEPDKNRAPENSQVQINVAIEEPSEEQDLNMSNNEKQDRFVLNPPDDAKLSPPMNNKSESTQAMEKNRTSENSKVPLEITSNMDKQVPIEESAGHPENSSFEQNAEDDEMLKLFHDELKES